MKASYRAGKRWLNRFVSLNTPFSVVPSHRELFEFQGTAKNVIDGCGSAGVCSKKVRKLRLKIRSGVLPHGRAWSGATRLSPGYRDEIECQVTGQRPADWQERHTIEGMPATVF